jgi:cellulase (glycosyl hydrolase family 5)/dockerin type I repeat protein
MIQKSKKFTKFPQAALIILAVIALAYVIIRARATTIVGDLNNDGTVNIYDLSILLSDWGTTNATADLNNDGTVNIYDLSILLSNWGQTAPTPTPSPSPTPSPATGFVTRSGNSLSLNGQVTQFIGFNTYGMTGCFNGTAWTTAQMDQYFSGLPANGLTRIWAFQYYGTSIINTILTEAAKYNQHVILSLGDDDSHCNDSQDAPGGDGSGKTLAFYQSDWQGAYLTWVNTIVPMFKDNPTIAMWEIANEPFHAGPGADPALSVQESYLNGTSAAIRADDPNHLIETGANDTADFGGLSNFEAAQSGPDIDVVSFHDYAWDYENKAVDSANFTSAQTAATADNKAFIGGEAGVEGGTGCTATTGLSLQAREQYLQQKTSNYMAKGIGALDFWEYEPANSHNATCAYEIFPGDPVIPMVQGL